MGVGGPPAFAPWLPTFLPLTTSKCKCTLELSVIKTLVIVWLCYFVGHGSGIAVKSTHMHPYPVPPRKTNVPLVIALSIGAPALLGVLLIGRMILASAGSSGPSESARPVAGRPWAVSTTGGDAYAMGHTWGHDWWIAQGSPNPDADYASRTCMGVDTDTMAGSPGPSGPPTAVIPNGGDLQWMSGCVNGLTGR